jgi:predicted O-methyltransferase YrrM
LNLFRRIIGGDGLHYSRLHDEKGNRISLYQTLEICTAVSMRLSQSLTDRPYVPWIPFAVISKLSGILNKESHVLEFGSGRSTIWYARCAHSVVSVEDSLEWFDKISRQLLTLGIDNVDYRFRPGDAYIDTASFAAEQFDLIVVDGSHRTRCIDKIYFALKAGGYLYLDDSDKDMTLGSGDLRSAEAKLLDLAERWHSSPEYYTGYAPGKLFPQQGMLVQKPLPCCTPSAS